MDVDDVELTHCAAKPPRERRRVLERLSTPVEEARIDALVLRQLIDGNVEDTVAVGVRRGDGHAHAPRAKRPAVPDDRVARTTVSGRHRGNHMKHVHVSASGRLPRPRRMPTSARKTSARENART